MMKSVRANFIITEEQAEQLRELSYTSRKTKSALVREALELLFKTVPEKETKL